MSNSPEPGRDQWPAPWASPSVQGGTMTDGSPDAATSAGAPDTARTTPMPAATPGAASDDAPHQPPQQDPHQPPQQDPYQPAQQAPYQGGYPADYPGGYQSAPPPQSPLFANPYGSPAPQQPRAPRDRRGPGWIGTVAVGAGAAVLASLLTAGIVGGPGRQLGSREPAPLEQRVQLSSQNSAPLVNSTASNPNWTAVAAAVQPSVVAVQLDLGSQGGDQGSGIIYDRAVTS